MDARLQLRVQRYGWDRAAPHYERAWREALSPATAAVLDAAQMQPGERVLDVACGSGLLTRAAWQAVAPGGGEVVGTDLSEQMLAIAAQRSPLCRFVRADAQEVDDCLPARHFDAVLCGLGLMYMPDPEAALAAMVRRLRPGGRLLASVWGERRACGWAEIFPIVDERVRSEVCPMFFRLGSGETLARALQGAGLDDVQAQRLTTQIVHADAQVACDAAFLGGPVALAYSRFDARTRDTVRSEYLEVIKAWYSEGGYRLPGEFVVGLGRRPENPLP